MVRTSLFLTIAVACVGVFVSTGRLPAQTAATVNGQAIEAAEVDALLRRSYRGKEISDDARPLLQAKALEELIDQRLVEDAVVRNKLGVSEEEVDIALADFKKKLKANRIEWERYLADNKLTEPLLRKRLSWAKNWGTYLARKIDEKALAEFFAAHRAAFDGSKLRAAHVLLKPEGKMTTEKRKELVTAAEDIRKQIESGTLTFEQAVQKHSGGTKKAAGDLGLIARRGDMPEAFSKAAFSLNKGEISPPVVTSFGVHLIRWTDIQPGEKHLDHAAVNREVRFALAQQTFNALAARERKSAKISYTGETPYLDPKTGDLMK